MVVGIMQIRVSGTENAPVFVIDVSLPTAVPNLYSHIFIYKGSKQTARISHHGQRPQLSLLKGTRVES